jgi:hypothetical protein
MWCENILGFLFNFFITEKFALQGRKVSPAALFLQNTAAKP